MAKALQDIADNNRILREMLDRMDARLTELEHGQARLQQGQTRLEQDVSVLKTDVAVLKTDVAVLKTDVAVLKGDVGVLKGDVGVLKGDVSTLKGDSLERKYRDTAAGLFGLYLKGGRDVTNRVADQLYAAVDAGTIPESDLIQVLASDLLWGGENRRTQEPIVLVMEASWRAEAHDVERAAARSATLRQIGINALGIVGGKEWSDAALASARQLGVATTTNGQVDRSSWDAAIQRF